MLVVALDVAVELVAKRLNAGEHSALECAASELTEPALHSIEPGCAGRGEMQEDARTLGQELLDLLGFVRAAVVQDDMQIQVLGHGAFDLAEEVDELLGAVSLRDSADHLARRDIHRGVQARRAVPCVVVRSAFDLPWAQRQHGLGAVEGLDLSLLVDREHHRIGRWVHVEPHDIYDFLGELRIIADLEGLEPVRP